MLLGRGQVDVQAMLKNWKIPLDLGRILSYFIVGWFVLIYVIRILCLIFWAASQK